jgi:23S rRNA pseudouridine1911/1915/1917 synthase
VIADRGDAGRRVDLVIRRHLTDIARATRTRVQSWIEGGRVSINGSPVTRVATRAALGDRVTVELPDEEPRAAVLPEKGQLDRLFEDDHLLVVNKPAGIVSHPTYLHPSGSLLNVVLYEAQHWPDGQRPSLVGRLDKHTSGAIVVAKTTPAHARMQRTLAAAATDKSYLALVYGPVTRERGVIDLRLRRDPEDRRRVVASTDHGVPSTTMFERLAQADVSGCTVALVRCRLVTGRMHQIRVHLAASGWPVIGDAKYGALRWELSGDIAAREHLRGFSRQALHAWRLSFVHPFSGERVQIEAPVPTDMAQLGAEAGLAVPPA